jgi:hypothetical protein
MKINANEQARLIPSLVVKQREAMSWERSAWKWKNSEGRRISIAGNPRVKTDVRIEDRLRLGIAECVDEARAIATSRGIVGVTGWREAG